MLLLLVEVIVILFACRAVAFVAVVLLEVNGRNIIGKVAVVLSVVLLEKILNSTIKRSSKRRDRSVRRAP